MCVHAPFVIMLSGNNHSFCGVCIKDAGSDATMRESTLLYMF